ncbi:MAG: sulfatase-like hydrolase/transferase [Gammaproteobacteria bacterium]|nr:sulfatase-like hydrolase/transferase [Gammaproteobacteria bacterium]
MWPPPPRGPPRGDSYFLTTDLADRAMEFIGGLRANDPDRPFLLYWATGAVHAPHHAPADAIARFRGAYDAGWDALRERTLERQHDLGLLPEGTVLAGKQGGVADWDDLAGAEQRLYARQMEAFAGQLAHADREFGRILELIDRLGERDNTLVVVTSDNGASAEGGMAGLHNEAVMFNGRRLSFEENAAFEDRWGGPETVNHFHAGWAAAGNTPFPYYKHHVDGGGTHVPLVLSWPDGIDARGVRSQYHHIIDLAPTLLAASGVPLPDTVDGVTQQPFDGIDMAYTFATAGTPSRRTVQYYEIWGNRGIYRDGWKAATIHNQIMPWQTPVPGDPAADVWRLYHVAEDFSESRDVAAEHPDKLRELQDLWEAEAQRYGVFPLDPDRRARFIAQMNRFGRREPVVRYLPEGARRIPEALSPPVKNRSFRITAHLDSPAGARAEGVIVAAGGITGGYALFVDEGMPVYVHNLYNEEHHYVRGTRSLPDGPVSLEFRFDRHDGGNGGVGTLLLDGAPVGTAAIPATVPNAFSIEDGFDIAMDDGSAVAPDYAVPFPFNGTVREVLFNMTPAEAETPP